MAQPKTPDRSFGLRFIYCAVPSGQIWSARSRIKAIGANPSVNELQAAVSLRPAGNSPFFLY